MIEKLGDALAAGWRLHVRCAFGKRDGMKAIKECVYRAELDMPTLVWTRGRNFPVARLPERLMCPRCGYYRMAVMFDPPGERGRARA